MGDGAQAIHQVAVGHAHAGIGNGDGFGLFIRFDGDAQSGFRLENGLTGGLHKAQPLASIRRVGNQLTNEDFTIRIEGMDYDIQQLLDLGLEMAPILEDLKREYAGILDVEFIDVWQKENAKKAEEYKVESIPTQVFLDSKGKELWRHVGFFSKEDILAKWKELGFSFEPKEKEAVTSGR